MKRKLSDIRKPFGYVSFGETIAIFLFVAFCWAIGIGFIRLIT